MIIGRLERARAMGGLVFGAVLVLCALGCGPDADREPATLSYEVEKEYTHEDATVVLKVDRTDLALTDTLELVIEAWADEACDVELPRYETAPGQLAVAEEHDSRPALTDDGRVVIARTFTLEPFVSGDYTIPSLQVVFMPDGEPEEAAFEIETEPVEIRVAPIVAEGAGDQELADIAPPVELPAGWAGWIYALITIALLAALIVGGLMLWRRRRRGVVTEARTTPAHEIALTALDALLAGDLLEQGAVKAFYNSVSDILRRYLENRFGLHAPERTTEEFLVELGRSSVLNNPHRVLLHEFLKHCDLVKFAELLPMSEEVTRTGETCRRIVHETAERSVEAAA